MSTKKLTMMSVLVAIGVVGAQYIWFPAGVAKAYPVQHAINVMSAVMLGTGPAVMVAFLIGLIRNALGLGTLLAFPGGMIGAFLAGYLYSKVDKKWAAATGEFIGTGVIGAFIAFPVSNFLLGTSVGAWFFIPSFLVSSVAGAAIGWIVVSRLRVFIRSTIQS